MQGHDVEFQALLWRCLARFCHDALVSAALHPQTPHLRAEAERHEKDAGQRQTAQRNIGKHAAFCSLECRVPSLSPLIEYTIALAAESNGVVRDQIVYAAAEFLRVQIGAAKVEAVVLAFRDASTTGRNVRESDNIIRGPTQTTLVCAGLVPVAWPIHISDPHAITTLYFDS